MAGQKFLVENDLIDVDEVDRDRFQTSWCTKKLISNMIREGSIPKMAPILL